MTQEGQEIKALLRDLDQRLTSQIADVRIAVSDARREVSDARKEVAEATRFQDGFQSVAKTLAYVLGIVVALASIYGVIVR